jgi:hypothetical protein
MEKYIARRDKFKATQKYKDGQDRYWASDKGKKTKAAIARRFNQTEGGRIVKRRADAKFRSSQLGRTHHKIQERLRKMGNIGRNASAKVLKWVGLEDASSVHAWIAKLLPSGEAFEDYQIDHVIPFNAYKWKRVGVHVIRNNEDMEEEEFKKLWNIENLQLLKGTSNQSKMVSLPSDEELLALRHLWPVWWQDTLPDSSLRSKLGRSRGKKVLG